MNTSKSVYTTFHLSKHINCSTDFDENWSPNLCCKINKHYLSEES